LEQKDMLSLPGFGRYSHYSYNKTNKMH